MMEETSTFELPKNNRIVLKLIIFLLAIAVVGQIAALYIPAFSGQSPNSSSMYSSLFWTSALFTLFWKINSKRKLTGFFVGAIIGFAFYFCAGVIAGYLQAKTTAIDEAVRNSNKGLPKMIDEDTRLDSLAISQDSKDYYIYITFINHMKSELDLDHTYIQETLRQSSCKDKSFRAFLDEGYSVNHIYRDKTGSVVSENEFVVSDC